MVSLPEKGPLAPSSSPEASSSVLQPIKADLGVHKFLDELNTISESMPTRPGEDLPASSGGSTTAMTTTGDRQAQAGQSWRDQAIANIPGKVVMQREITKHIQVEVKKLRKEARKIARMSQPGAAFHLNQLYSKIHRLNSLLAEVIEAGYEVMKRLYIRIFVDKQPIL